MNRPRGDNQRKYARFETNIPVHFNLNPEYHFVPQIRRLGVGGTVRNVSLEGLMLDSRLDLLDVCQIFSEAMEDDSPFELEVVADFRRRRLIIRGSVRWYQVSEPQGDIRQFKAGLHLKEYESRTVAANIVEFITGIAMA